MGQVIGFSSAVFFAFLADLKASQDWRSRDYNVLSKNCHTFAQFLCAKLGVSPLPNFVTLLPEFLTTNFNLGKKTASPSRPRMHHQRRFSKEVGGVCQDQETVTTTTCEGESDVLSYRSSKFHSRVETTIPHESSDLGSSLHDSPRAKQSPKFLSPLKGLDSLQNLSKGRDETPTTSTTTPNRSGMKMSNEESQSITSDTFSNQSIMNKMSISNSIPNLPPEDFLIFLRLCSESEILKKYQAFKTSSQCQQNSHGNEEIPSSLSEKVDDKHPSIFPTIEKSNASLNIQNKRPKASIILNRSKTRSSQSKTESSIRASMSFIEPDVKQPPDKPSFDLKRPRIETTIECPFPPELHTASQEVICNDFFS